MNPGTKTAQLASIALLLGVGCDALGVRPGHDFAVTVLNEQPIQAVGLLTVPLRMAVTGCDAVQADVGRGTDRHAIDIIRQGDGTWASAVPVEWVRGEDGACLFDATAPQATTARLWVTCMDAGRSIASDLAINYGTATKAYVPAYMWERTTVEYLFPSANPLLPYSMSPSSFIQWAGTSPLLPTGVNLGLDGFVMQFEPLYRPRLAEEARGVVMSVGCATGEFCPTVDVSPGQGLGSERLVGAAGYWSGFDFSQLWPVYVPNYVLDLAYVADGTLVVLSEFSDYRTSSWTVVTRVLPPQVGVAADVQVIAFFSDERVRSRFSRAPDGKLAFATLAIPQVAGPLVSVLHTTDGQTVTSLPSPTGSLDVGQRQLDGTVSFGSVQLSPDAASILVNGAYLGTPSGTYLALPTPGPFPGDGYSGGAIWPAGAVGLWRGTGLWDSQVAAGIGRVEVFAAAPPHPRVYAYDALPLPGNGSSVVLVGATAVGDKVVLTTSTGVRVLGPDGTIVGGADPLPCRLSPTAVAVQTGPNQVAVGAGTFIYVFDLAGFKD